MQTRFLKILLCSALVLAGCIIDTKQTRGGSVVDNELAGRLFLADGSPAVNARVRAYPVDHVPDSSLPGASTVTDSAGNFAFGSLARGEYNILGELDGKYSYQDSLRIDGLASIPPDTLDAPGSLAGVAVLQPDHDPKSVTVQVLGTDNYANVDEEGRFTLDNLAEGKYRLRLVTTLDGYTPLFVGVTVRAAAKDTLPDSLHLPYTGIPVVTGLAAEYDTLRGIVTLRWNRVKYRALSGYLVYRDSASTTRPSDLPVARVQDTAFADTLFPMGRNGLPTGDLATRKFRYRVRVVNLSEQIGLGFGSPEVIAASPLLVRTAIRFDTPRIEWDSAAQTDSVTVAVHLDNPTRALTRLAWSLDRQDSTVRVLDLHGKLKVSDTLAFGWRREGPVTLYFEAKDTAGLAWRDSLTLPGNRAAKLSGSPAAQGKAFAEYRFVPSASDSDGDRLIFTVENLPPWAAFDSATGAISGTPTNKDTGTYKEIRIGVSDGRRLAWLGPFNLHVEANPWMPLKPKADIGGGPSASIGGKVYLLLKDYPFTHGGSWSNDLRVYDPETDSYSNAPNMPVNIELASVCARDKQLFVSAAWHTLYPKKSYSVILTYDTETKTWAQKAPAPSPNAQPVTLNGKLYLVGGGDTLGNFAYDVHEYDEARDGWIRKSTIPAGFKVIRVGQAFGIGGRIQVVCTVKGGDESEIEEIRVLAYDPVSGEWETGPTHAKARHRAGVCASGGRIFFLGGLSRYGSQSAKDASNQVMAYDPASRAWSERKPMGANRMDLYCTSVEDRIFAQGGLTANSTLSSTSEVYDPAFD